jgi:SepF-like predicted cell division protein (DUF552 family)
MAFNFLKRKSINEEETPEFIEIGGEQEIKDSKVLVKTFILKEYEDINEILNALREGYTIAVIDIRHLKNKDVIELKRVISKIKKTVEAMEGSIAGFGENTVIAVPPFARIQKGKEEVQKKKSNDGLERF